MTTAAGCGIVISMNFDMWSSLGDVDRSVRDDIRDGRPVRVLVVEREYDAPRSEVWDAVTTGERVSRWLGPVTGDLELGGRFQVEGNAGGTVLGCVAPERLEVTWEYAGDVSWVVLTLAEHGTVTALRLEHSAVVDQEKWGEFGPGAVGIGWEMALGGLGLHLADPGFSPGQPDFAHPGYPAFVRASGDAWAAADVASGTDAALAESAAERCYAAYTAIPDPGTGDSAAD